jgi:hypothetical protein
MCVLLASRAVVEQVIPRLDHGPRDRVCFLCTLTSLLTDSGLRHDDRIIAALLGAKYSLQPLALSHIM